MTVTDSFLNEVAESFVTGTIPVPSHVGFSNGTSIIVDPTSTSLQGEFGSRVAVTSNNTLNETTFSGIRSGAAASSSGDSLNSFGLFTASSSGVLCAQAIITNLLQTSDFDVEVEWVIKAERK